MKDLRNRVFHHDPIWDNLHLRNDYGRGLEVLGWMDLSVAETVRRMSRPHFTTIHTTAAAFAKQIVEIGSAENVL